MFCWLKVVAQTKVARLKVEWKQHQHSYSAKGNLFWAAQTQAVTFQLTGELPAKVAAPTMAAIHNQEHFWHSICHMAVFAASQLLFQEEKHSRAKMIPGYRLKNRTEEPSDTRAKWSIQKATKGSPGSTSRWNEI